MFISSRRQLPPAQLPPAPPLLVLLVLTGSVLAAKDPNHTLIHEWPMLMAHDAATTYLPSGLLHPINTCFVVFANIGFVELRFFAFRFRL